MIDVSRNFDYGFPREGQAPGLQVSKSIPFTGDYQLWHWRPNHFGSNTPRAVVRGQRIEVGIEVLADQSDSAVDHIEGTIEQIKIYLQRQEDQIKQHNEVLAKLALPYIADRRARVGNAADLLRKLGG